MQIIQKWMQIQETYWYEVLWIIRSSKFKQDKLSIIPLSYLNK